VRGSYKVIENAGHYPQAEMPEIAGPIILNFIQSLSRN
jgi:hypothetical protein